MVDATLVFSIASGQSTVPNFTVLEPAPPPPQAPNKNEPKTSRSPNSAALTYLPPLPIYPILSLVVYSACMRNRTSEGYALPRRPPLWNFRAAAVAPRSPVLTQFSVYVSCP